MPYETYKKMCESLTHCVNDSINDACDSMHVNRIDISEELSIQIVKCISLISKCVLNEIVNRG